jgi:predicted AAA+ superfamily ATPase
VNWESSSRASNASSTASKRSFHRRAPAPGLERDRFSLAQAWRARGTCKPCSTRIRSGTTISLPSSEQKRAIDANTRQFVAALPAKQCAAHRLRDGTGKSSLIKAMLVKYAAKGLRLIEVDKADLGQSFPTSPRSSPRGASVSSSTATTSRFDAGEPGYKAHKVMLDGTIAAPSANMLIYATSNRRHLIPEYFSENLETTHIGAEVHPGESVEEKISLSERFGLWIHVLSVQPGTITSPRRRRGSLHSVVAQPRSARENEARQREALQYALQRGARAAVRVAWQFARGYAGAHGLRKK